MTPRTTRLFSLTRSQRYVLAVSGVMFTAVVRIALGPILAGDLPLYLFTVPITLASWFGGLGPGLLATGLSVVIANYGFIPPRGSSFLHYESRLNRSAQSLWQSSERRSAFSLKRIEKRLPPVWNAWNASA